MEEYITVQQLKDARYISKYHDYLPELDFWLLFTLLSIFNLISTILPKK